MEDHSKAAQDAERFRESLKLLKSIIQKRTTNNHNAAVNDNKEPEFLEETWKAKLSLLQAELKEEQEKRLAAEELNESLQKKISTVLEPVINSLENQFNGLKREKEDLVRKMEEMSNMKKESMSQLQAALERMTNKRDNVKTALKRKEEEHESFLQDMELAVEKERQQFTDEIVSLKTVIEDMEMSQNKMQSFYEEQIQQQTAEAEEDAKSSHALREHILDHLQIIVESAGEAIDAIQSASLDPTDSSLRKAKELKDVYYDVVDEAMKMVTKICDEKSGSATRGQYESMSADAEVAKYADSADAESEYSISDAETAVEDGEGPNNAESTNEANARIVNDAESTADEEDEIVGDTASTVEEDAMSVNNADSNMDEDAEMVDDTESAEADIRAESADEQNEEDSETMPDEKDYVEEDKSSAAETGNTAMERLAKNEIGSLEDSQTTVDGDTGRSEAKTSAARTEDCVAPATGGEIDGQNDSRLSDESALGLAKRKVDESDETASTKKSKM